MGSLIVDTHSAVWYLSQSPQLSAAVESSMDSAVANSQPIYVSAITLIEITYLIEKKRLQEGDC